MRMFGSFQAPHRFFIFGPFQHNRKLIFCEFILYILSFCEYLDLMQYKPEVSSSPMIHYSRYLGFTTPLPENSARKNYHPRSKCIDRYPRTQAFRDQYTNVITLAAHPQTAPGELNCRPFQPNHVGDAQLYVEHEYPNVFPRNSIGTSKLLAKSAMRIKADSKALHHWETCFKLELRQREMKNNFYESARLGGSGGRKPYISKECLTGLIQCYSNLGCTESAEAMVEFAQATQKSDFISADIKDGLRSKYKMPEERAIIDEKSYMLVGDWKKAKPLYQKKLENLTLDSHIEDIVGLMNCHGNLREWDLLDETVKKHSGTVEKITNYHNLDNSAGDDSKKMSSEFHKLAAKGIWNLVAEKRLFGEESQHLFSSEGVTTDQNGMVVDVESYRLTEMKNHLKQSNPEDPEIPMLQSIYNLQVGNVKRSRKQLDEAWERHTFDVYNLSAEANARVYNAQIKAQHLAELDEIVTAVQGKHATNVLRSKEVERFRYLNKNNSIPFGGKHDNRPDTVQSNACFLRGSQGFSREFSAKVKLWLKRTTANRPDYDSRMKTLSLSNLIADKTSQVSARGKVAMIGARKGNFDIIVKSLKPLIPTLSNENRFPTIPVVYDTDTNRDQATLGQNYKEINSVLHPRAWLAYTKYQAEYTQSLDSKIYAKTELRKLMSIFQPNLDALMEIEKKQDGRDNQQIVYFEDFDSLAKTAEVLENKTLAGRSFRKLAEWELDFKKPVFRPASINNVSVDKLFRNIPYRSEDQEFKCDECSEIFTLHTFESAEKLRLHKETTRCKDCTWFFGINSDLEKSKEYMPKHMKTHHLLGRFYQEKCEYFVKLEHDHIGLVRQKEEELRELNKPSAVMFQENTVEHCEVDSENENNSEQVTSDNLDDQMENQQTDENKRILRIQNVKKVKKEKEKLMKQAEPMTYQIKKSAATAIKHYALAVCYKSDKPGHDVSGYQLVVEDLLAILDLLFKHGAHSEVKIEIEEAKNKIFVNNWLYVQQQLLARTEVIFEPSAYGEHNKERDFRIGRLLADLISKVGRKHPQAIVYALLVSINTYQSEYFKLPDFDDEEDCEDRYSSDPKRNPTMEKIKNRQKFADHILKHMEYIHTEIVNDARRFSEEMVRCAQCTRWYEVPEPNQFNDIINREYKNHVLKQNHRNPIANKPLQDQIKYCLKALRGYYSMFVILWNKYYAQGCPPPASKLEQEFKIKYSYEINNFWIGNNGGATGQPRKGLMGDGSGGMKSDGSYGVGLYEDVYRYHVDGVENNEVEVRKLIHKIIDFENQTIAKLIEKYKRDVHQVQKDRNPTARLNILFKINV